MRFYNLNYHVIVLITVIQSCDNSTYYQSDIQDGNLDQTFVNSDNDLPVDTSSVFVQPRESSDTLAGWSAESISNGVMPSCYNFKPRKSSIDNRLEVSVGGGTDVAIKVMDQLTDKCIRYVFINSGSTYSIRNIPEGIYYLKIAYGKNWVSKVENGRCEGKFMTNPLYEKGLDLLDFNIQDFGDTKSVPSYKLDLDVISTDVMSSFSSSNISETAFNK